MGKAAEIALKMRTDQTALDLLDQICERWRRCDAEFEHPFADAFPRLGA